MWTRFDYKVISKKNFETHAAVVGLADIGKKINVANIERIGVRADNGVGTGRVSLYLYPYPFSKHILIPIISGYSKITPISIGLSLIHI